MSTTLDGLESINAIMNDLRQCVETADYSDDMAAFLPRMAEQEVGMFAGEYDSALVDWASLAPSTIRRKKHDRILLETGALRTSLTTIGGPGNISEVFPHGFTFGTDVPYAGFHQDGTLRMPARPPVGISEETIDRLCNVVADAVVDKMMAN